MYVYELTHEYYNPNEDCDMVTDIAVYSSQIKAEAALKRMEQHPYFVRHPGEFCIDIYLVNKSEWTEGFTGFDE